MPGVLLKDRDGAAKVRVVFFGTPEFALPSLRTLAVDERFELALVVTQPDRPAGRGRRLDASPVARFARERALPLYQPESLRTEEARTPLADANPDLFVVAAFGLIFGRRTLAIPRLGCVNVHASLLPRYRGASPIAAALLSGDERTGVTLMRMDARLDTGPILAAAAMPILPGDTTAALSDRLGELGGDLLASVLPRYASGEIAPTPQPGQGASLTRPLSKADGWIDWSRSATDLDRHVRAMWPWPRAWTTVDDEPLQIHRATSVGNDGLGPVGRGFEREGSLVVACGRGALRLDLVQPAGGRPMAGSAFVAGHRATELVFGTTGQPLALPPVVTPLPG